MSRCRRLLAVALVALVARLDAEAVAQGARGLPDPISSSMLVELLVSAGLDPADVEIVAVPLDHYHAAFRSLRSGPIEAWLEEKRESSGGGFGDGDAETIEDRIDERLSLADRIAAIDDRLFADLREAGVDDSVAERARLARSRDRSRTLAGGRYTRGLRFEPTAVFVEVAAEREIDGDAAYDATVREILEAHDRDRTGRLASLARAAVEVPIERAALLAAVDGGAPDPESATPEAFQQWFAARRQAERTAAEDVRRMQASLVAADRQALDRVLVTAADDPAFVRAFRDAWLEAAHSGLFPDRESPASLFDTARELHAAGDLDDDAFELVESVETSWRARHRGIEDRMLRALEQAIEDGARTGSSLGGMIEIELAGDGSSPKADELDEARQARADLDREVRARLGEISPATLATRVKDGPVPTFSLGGGEGGQVTFSVAVVANDGMAIGDGEPIAIEIGDLIGDLDFGDGAVFVSTAMGVPGGGGANGLPRPIDPAAFDLICTALGLDEVTRPIADSLFADYRNGWAEVDSTLVAEWNEVPKGGFGPQGPIRVEDEDLTRAAGLRLAIFDAILQLDRGLFDDLALVSGADAATAGQAARRRRSVSVETTLGGGLPMMPGSDRTGLVDLVDAADGALAIQDIAMIAEPLDEWSASHTPALEDRARAFIGLDRDLAITQQQMERAFQQAADGGVAVGFDLDSAVAERMQALQQRRSSIDRGLAAGNVEWTERIAARLATADEDAADAFRLAVDREAWPQSFRDPRSPEENFDRAIRLDDLGDGTRAAIESLRAEWLNSWIGACRRLVELERSGPRMEPFASDPSSFDPAAMQKAEADKRRVRFERNEIDEKAMRELKSLLSPAQQEAVGDLPEERRRMLAPGMSDVQMIIGG